MKTLLIATISISFLFMGCKEFAIKSNGDTKVERMDASIENNGDGATHTNEMHAQIRVNRQGNTEINTMQSTVSVDRQGDTKINQASTQTVNQSGATTVQTAQSQVNQVGATTVANSVSHVSSTGSTTIDTAHFDPDLSELFGRDLYAVAHPSYSVCNAALQCECIAKPKEDHTGILGRVVDVLFKAKKERFTLVGQFGDKSVCFIPQGGFLDHDVRDLEFFIRVKQSGKTYPIEVIGTITKSELLTHSSLSE